MTQHCPQCGAEIPAGTTCRDRFDACLALEFEQPAAFGAVHHLTVLCYMLQHNAYSRDAWLDARALLVRFVAEDLTPEAARRRRREAIRRPGSIVRGSKLAAVDAIVWSRTVADVRLTDAATYCADVAQWARSVVDDTAPLAGRIADETKAT